MIQSALKTAKCFVAMVLYRSGALFAYHRLFNRRTLTVAMFHRVLPHDDPRFASALPAWTVTTEVFDACLAFFVRHYAVVSLWDVLASIDGAGRLPDRALLITFDDGYADNLLYATPLLRRRGLAAAVFVSSCVLGRRERLWTEDLLWLHKSGALDENKIVALRAAIAKEGFPAAKSLVEIVRAGAQWPHDRVERILSESGIVLPSCPERQMLEWRELPLLAQAGIAIGAHGATHSAFPYAEHLARELEEPRQQIAEALGPLTEGSAGTLSFPHGLFSDVIVAEARRWDYRLFFTTAEELMPVEAGRPLRDLIGRINVDARRIAARNVVKREALAVAFFLRPHARSEKNARSRPGDG
jgi:peptidoglycan/xylan/chitin deacetylase (PgdA/CDA1 family)